MLLSPNDSVSSAYKKGFDRGRTYILTIQRKKEQEENNKKYNLDYQSFRKEGNMRSFKIGDKVLCMDNYKSLIKGNVYKILPAANGPENYLMFAGSTTFRIETKEQTNYFTKTKFILAETDSVERAMEHIQKDMWVKTKTGEIVKSVGSRPDEGIIYTARGVIIKKGIEKIYFYNPEINKKEDEAKKKQIQELREVIFKAEKVRDELINSLEEGAPF